MDKICIVKRRREHVSQPYPPSLSDQNAHVREFDFANGHGVSIVLTSEQTRLLQRSNYVRELLSGSTTDPSLTIRMAGEEKMVLDLSSTASHLRMLRCDQVCQILQISRSFLQRLIRDKRIRSYKMGRLRRFEMEDIIDYLSSHEDTARLTRD